MWLGEKKGDRRWIGISAPYDFRRPHAVEAGLLPFTGLLGYSLWMPTTYPTELPSIEPALLDDRMLLAIGKLIRCCAELEDLITLYICRLFGLTEGKAAILLGQMAISQRLRLAEAGAAGTGNEEPAVFENAFKHDSFKMIVEARNIVAHGLVIGRTSEGKYAFRTWKKTALEKELLSTELMLYDAATLEDFVEVAEDGIKTLPQVLKLHGQLRLRGGDFIGPHSKSQPKKKRTGGVSSRPAPEENNS